MAGDATYEAMTFDDEVGGLRVTNTAFEVFAFVAIPTGYKATHVCIYTSQSMGNFHVWESNINSTGLGSLKGSGSTGTLSSPTVLNITDVSSTSTNYLTIKVLRLKDVLTKIHGGGATDRKRKLLEKQKRGKARSKQFGKVEIPQEAFIGVLKINKDA